MKRTPSTLWAYRHRPTKGWDWYIERTVDEETSELDLQVARERDPAMSFAVSKSKPKGTPV